jgi:hypothetical protein
MHNNYKDDFTDISPFAKYVAVLSLLDCNPHPKSPFPIVLTQPSMI